MLSQHTSITTSCNVKCSHSLVYTTTLYFVYLKIPNIFSSTLFHLWKSVLIPQFLATLGNDVVELQQCEFK